ncbi:hypothetical protein LTR91_025463 [Friedmanniomyces endolithicus]|uniref:Uncharacterized protein n=1 Tax=Friedmanniomyces endolithicus TaxID=329885 RepID=A0AAN6K304_9PEZI|nr:hypothetical protein LTR87_007376 [Friedmanniomyces endolithicus]KAK0891231.1 hypothetical protein LTR02_014148 [Friedmanniomyces endolithicus]KAK0950710.1 hypothetical protein LTR91_025463 [Friedmanniomyces endolithicus]KAK1085420.1 hypothetical protein LTR33_002104 [Friedmanniomyces endolithicus]
MAPDINFFPQSPQAPSRGASRRTSQHMPPPPPPPTITPASATPHTSSQPHRSPGTTMAMSNEGHSVPMRHPRPLTAAELYLECEKEQEAIVNRLTRELTALRAQSASVASNASHSSTSTSASLLPVDIASDPTHQMTGATHPTPSRRHRSSSSLSSRSMHQHAPSTNVSVGGSGHTSTSTQAHMGSTAGVPAGGVSQASADRAAAARASLSRQPSITTSGASTPARQSLDVARHAGQTPGTLYTLPHRPSLSRDTSYASTQAQTGTPVPHPLPSPAQSPSQSIHPSMQHYADTVAYRTEMEIVKAENEALRQRVRNLERALRSRRRDSSQSAEAARPELGARVVSGREAVASPAGVAAWAAGDGGVGGVAGPRERSESQSTTASSRRGPGFDEEVKVGESAQSAGIGRTL